MKPIDILLVTALAEEHDAAREVALASGASGLGVKSWSKEEPPEIAVPLLIGRYTDTIGAGMTIALARPSRMGGPSVGPVLGSLVQFLKPRCVAMCGVCAGNPGEAALGDVVIAELAYQYDEGKRKAGTFEPDHRQVPMFDRWVLAAQTFDPSELPSFGEPSAIEADRWLLEQLFAGNPNPENHLARARYFPGSRWESSVQSLQSRGFLRKHLPLKLTKLGEKRVKEDLILRSAAPERLPFRVKVGPIASGNVVVKDGVTWENLKQWGVRTVVGLEMEAATVANTCHRLEVPRWLVAKGVMDYADPRKDDRYKPFAARASAEVLFKFLWDQFGRRGASGAPPMRGLVKSVYVIGGVTQETTHPGFEDVVLKVESAKLGGIIAQAGAELIVCSPFPDSADVHVVMGYANARVGGTIHFYSPRHERVRASRSELDEVLGETTTKIINWFYPPPENEESWSQAWMLCQLQALEKASVVIALGGRISKSANTLLHLADLRRIPVVPFAFLGGAAKRSYERTDWPSLDLGFDHTLLTGKHGVLHAMEIADQLVLARLHGRIRGGGCPRRFFISRASTDAAFGDRLATYMSSAGLTPLLGDAAISDSRNVQPSIEEAILKADVCIVLWSKAYALSRWCYDELEYGLQRAGVGELSVWLFNLDGTDVIPPRARGLMQAMARTPEALVEAFRTIIKAET